MTAKTIIKTCAKTWIRVRHVKIIKIVFAPKAVSHMSDNQWYIWWDRLGRFLGPRRVRNDPIALLKINVR